MKGHPSFPKFKNAVEIKIRSENEIIEFLVPKEMVSTSSVRLFVLWITLPSVVLIIIALIFLKNQTKPLVRLAKAAERFGKGDYVNDFSPSGAQEIRKAAYEFDRMAKRINRHLNQRSEMLSGISHDLRTPLTRLKLQLAMIKQKDLTEKMSKAIFEKNLREIASKIKDSYVKKYTLEYFLQKISELTPNINSKFRNNYRKFPKSLAKTKSYYNETKSLKSFEIKEFSFLYILLAKPKLVRENFHLLDNVKLFSDENKQLYNEILNQSDNLLNLNFQELNIDKSLTDRVVNYASVKHIISKNLSDDEKILEIFEEIIKDLKNYELEQRISELESKFSQDLSETTFNELKELKKLQKIN